MGLIEQCDDQLGVLLDHMERSGRLRDTMIVLTSDHGDYLGDHWLGEKDLFHEPAVKIPLIVYDPRPSADGARGATCDALVEAIDLAPTFVEAAGGDPASHILEGRSLAPHLRGERPAWREAVFSEYDFSPTSHATTLGLAPMLFDLQDDPNEYHDLAKAGVEHRELDRLYGLLARWARRNAQRVTRSDAEIEGGRGRSDRRGILPFLVDGSEVSEDLTRHYRGPAPRRFTDG